MNIHYRLSVVLPVHNEDKSLSFMIKILETMLDFPHEVLIVFDQLEDSSIKPAKELQKIYQISDLTLVYPN